jgi:ADP-ribosylglycohydrolase
MRVSAAAWAKGTWSEVMDLATKSAMVTHNHPEGIRGAQATATAIYMARKKYSKEDIKEYIKHTFWYYLDFTLDEIRPSYQFDETCQGTVPQAIVAFLESKNFEDAIKLAISLGGDADTLAAITGSIAEAYYGIPKRLINKAKSLIPQEFVEIIEKY